MQTVATIHQHYYSEVLPQRRERIKKVIYVKESFFFSSNNAPTYFSMFIKSIPAQEHSSAKRSAIFS